MIPLIKAMAPALGRDAAILPMWVALSLGACLGGNETLIGASAVLDRCRHRTVRGGCVRPRQIYGSARFR